MNMPNVCLLYTPPILFTKRLLLEIAGDSGPLQSSSFYVVIKEGQVKSCPPEVSRYSAIAITASSTSSQKFIPYITVISVREPQNSFSLLQKTALSRPSTICISTLLISQGSNKKKKKPQHICAHFQDLNVSDNLHKTPKSYYPQSTVISIVKRLFFIVN